MVTILAYTHKLSKHLNCSNVSDEYYSQAGGVFHEVGPDEQNARGPMEIVLL